MSRKIGKSNPSDKINQAPAGSDLTDLVDPIDPTKLEGAIDDVFLILRHAKQLRDEALQFDPKRLINKNRLNVIQRKIANTQESNAYLKYENKKLRNKLKAIKAFLAAKPTKD